MPFIRKRKAKEHKMLLAIVTNPHLKEKSDRKILWDALEADQEKEPVEEKLDKISFENFKQVIAGQSRRIKVK